MNCTARIVLILSLALTPIAAFPDDATPSSCSEYPHRQFDFWLGNWEVTEDGEPVGRTRVSLRHDNCVVAEEWTGVDGSTGTGLSLYDASSGEWRQAWVDSHGTLLLLSGGMEGASMIMRGAVRGHGGRPDTLHHVTWTMNDDGTVEQLWQSSTDHGHTWAVQLNGLSRRMDPAP